MTGRLCEICKTFPAHMSVGFASNPKELPGLPEHLLGASLPVCDDSKCNTAAQSRALTAAARFGVKPTRLWRTYRMKPEENRA